MRAHASAAAKKDLRYGDANGRWSFTHVAERTRKREIHWTKRQYAS
jgi:hypothetical protein